MNISQKIFNLSALLLSTISMSALLIAMDSEQCPATETLIDKVPTHCAVANVLSGKKVLLVDDNKINLKIGSKHLKEIGVLFETAENGTLAIEKAGESLFHIILMDIQMPEIHGIETAQTIRDLGKVMPIIAYTSDEETEYYTMLKQYLKEKNLEKSPINDYLKKPSNLEQLEAMLRKHLSKQESELLHELKPMDSGH